MYIQQQISNYIINIQLKQCGTHTQIARWSNTTVKTAAINPSACGNLEHNSSTM